MLVLVVDKTLVVTCVVRVTVAVVDAAKVTMLLASLFQLADCIVSKISASSGYSTQTDGRFVSNAVVDIFAEVVRVEITEVNKVCGCFVMVNVLGELKMFVPLIMSLFALIVPSKFEELYDQSNSAPPVMTHETVMAAYPQTKNTLYGNVPGAGFTLSVMYDCRPDTLKFVFTICRTVEL